MYVFNHLSNIIISKLNFLYFFYHYSLLMHLTVTVCTDSLYYKRLKLDLNLLIIVLF